MIGWSRRGEEYRRERYAWLATLTPEQRREEADYQDYVGRVWFRSMPLFFLGWMFVLFLADLAMPRFGPVPVMVVGISSVPGSISCPFFLCIMAKRA